MKNTKKKVIAGVVALTLIIGGTVGVINLLSIDPPGATLTITIQK